MSVFPEYFFTQTDTCRKEHFSFHAQLTLINQYKPGFHAPYSGVNSLKPGAEDCSSMTSTFYAAARLWKNATFAVNPEVAGGSGLSKALGIADATNGETFRIGSATPKLYLARIFLRQLFAVGKSYSCQNTGINIVKQNVPDRYISLTAGKVAISDYFDNNSYSHDPRTQFMNWGLMNNGAWDYPANTRGYTPSFVAEYISPLNELRGGISLMPLSANGNNMNPDLLKAHSLTMEYARHFNLAHHASIVRALAYYSTANMGSYRQSIFYSPVNPDIISTRQYGRSKYGFGINAESALSSSAGLFLRASWNDGHDETWAFTEIDHSASAGAVFYGTKWKRKLDRLGVAAVVSGLSTLHRQYLAAGGNGFMLGDGKLKYAPEKVLELYYTAGLLQNKLQAGLVYQLVDCPGYNADRKGPVHVFSIRLHASI